MSAYEARSNSKQFIEITQNEFSSVSELIRGRSKLEDINKVSFRGKKSKQDSLMVEKPSDCLALITLLGAH